MDMAVVLSVNAGRVAPFAAGDGSVSSGIVKAPVEGPVAVRGVNVVGDEQADLRVHGGPDQAVYAYASESYAWWASALGESPAPGTFGENLTTEGVDVDDAVIGTRWRIGTTLLEVTAPRIPCAKLGKRMGDPRFVRRFAEARRPGAYLRIVREGKLAAGDAIEVVAIPDHGVTIREVNEAKLFDRVLIPRLLDAPELSARERAWALARLA